MGEIKKFKKPIYDSKGTDWSDVLDIDNILDLSFCDILEASKFLAIRYMYENLEENKALPDEIENVYNNCNDLINHISPFIYYIITELLISENELLVDTSINNPKKYIDKIINNEGSDNYSIELIYNLVYKFPEKDKISVKVIIKFEDGIIISFLILENTKSIIMDSVKILKEE